MTSLFSCYLPVKMAQSISHVSLVLFAISLHYVSPSDFTPLKMYPSGSLACKAYNMTKMDCSNRNLHDVPVLDQNLTTSLDLSHNQLISITSNAPFQKLQILLLDLSYNEISKMSSTAFRGLHSLESLDLQRNRLIDLPRDIFSDLHNVQFLNLNSNFFTAVPDQVLASLYSLRYLSF